MQQQLLERERRIRELEAQLAAVAPVQSMRVPQKDTSQTEPRVEPVQEPESLHSYTTWEQFAALVRRNRSRLIEIVKDWSASERATLPPLLATYLEEKPDVFDETLTWISPNLLKAALSRLTFTVQGVPGCRFVSLEYLGKDSEQWLFADGENRLIPLSSRDGFAIGCF